MIYKIRVMWPKQNLWLVHKPKLVETFFFIQKKTVCLEKNRAKWALPINDTERGVPHKKK